MHRPLTVLAEFDPAMTKGLHGSIFRPVGITSKWEAFLASDPSPIRTNRLGTLAPTARGGKIPQNRWILMPEIDVYTQPWCPYCARAVHILTTKGVEFREIDAPNGSKEREEAVRRSGGRSTVPQIFIGGQHIGGCDDLVALDRAGKLDPLLQAG